MSLVSIEQHGDCLHIVLNRPSKLNALSPDLLQELIDAIEELKTRPVPIIVVRGAGRAFSAGADLLLFGQALMGPNAREMADLGRRACQAVASLTQLTVATIDGPCIGGGIALALNCDLRWATKNSHFAMPELPTGIPVGWGAIEQMVDTLGVNITKELIYTGKRLSSSEARQIGLLGQVFEDKDGFEDGLAQLAKIPRSTLEATHRQFAAVRDGTYDAHMDADIMVASTKDPAVVSSLFDKWQKHT